MKNTIIEVAQAGLSAYAAQQASLANGRAAKAEFMPKVVLAATGS